MWLRHEVKHLSASRQSSVATMRPPLMCSRQTTCIKLRSQKNADRTTCNTRDPHVHLETQTARLWVTSAVASPTLSHKLSPSALLAVKWWAMRTWLRSPITSHSSSLGSTRTLGLHRRRRSRSGTTGSFRCATSRTSGISPRPTARVLSPSSRRCHFRWWQGSTPSKQARSVQERLTWAWLAPGTPCSDHKSRTQVFHSLARDPFSFRHPCSSSTSHSCQWRETNLSWTRT